MHTNYRRLIFGVQQCFFKAQILISSIFLNIRIFITFCWTEIGVYCWLLNYTNCIFRAHNNKKELKLEYKDKCSNSTTAFQFNKKRITTKNTHNSIKLNRYINPQQKFSFLYKQILFDINKAESRLTVIFSQEFVHTTSSAHGNRFLLSCPKQNCTVLVEECDEMNVQRREKHERE